MGQKEKKGVSRRDFLKGAAAVSAVSLTAAVVPQALSAEATETTSLPGTPSWAVPPAPIPASAIVRSVNADVVVVGAGLAGLSAAASAKDQGLTVAVVEKAATWSGRGGGIGVANSRFLRKAGIVNDLEPIAREWMSLCGNRAKEPLVWKFLRESESAMDWFLDKSEKAKLPCVLWDGYYRGETYREYPGYHMFVGGPMMKKGANPAADCSYLLYEDAVSAGVTFTFEAPAEQLVKENGRVTAVIAKTKDGYVRFNATRGVVLATGDIGGSSELCAAWAPFALRANESQYTPVGVNTGDGHKMGLWAGGAMEDTPFPTMIHPQAFAWLNYSSLFVNQKGQRYMNEDTWVQAKSLQAMHQPGDGPWAFSIIDANWPQVVSKTIPYGGGMFWDSFRVMGQKWTPAGDKATMARYIKDGKFAFQADNLDDLAAQIHVPATALKATVARYNDLAAQQQDLDFGKRKELLYPIEKGPFIALKFGGALLAVCGGLEVDPSLRVLDKNQDPVPGLFAVGNVSGGLYGVDYPICVPGNSHGRALTWGYLVGQTLAKV